jgi:MOSC domain-containing protein YiiM
MKVVSVNVGKPREVEWKDTLVTTGIFKDPVDGPVMIRELNLDGDQQADLTVHGGTEKAVYGYASEHYEYWKHELPGVKFPWGKFGENLTTEGLFEDALHIGDRLKVGSAVLTVTQPRLPCYKLTVRFNRDDMIKRFLTSRRSGFYFSVENEGEVMAGSEIEILSRDPNHVSVADISRLYFSKDTDEELLQRSIKVGALPESWRDELIVRAEGRNR